MVTKTAVEHAEGAIIGESEQVKRIALSKNLTIQLVHENSQTNISYHGLSVASLAAKLGDAELEQIADNGQAAMVQALLKARLPIDLGDGWQIVLRRNNICLDENTITNKDKLARNVVAYCGHIEEMARPVIENIIVAPMTVETDLGMAEQVDVLKRTYQTRLNALLGLINKRG